MSFLPKSRTQKYQINNDGTQTVRCYSPANPQYYKDKNGNYYDIDLSHTSSLNNSNVGNFTLKEKNINSLGIRQDDNKEKYIGIRPDDTQEDGTQQLEWSIVSASVNGNDIPIDLSQNEFVNNNQVNLGNVTLFSTRRYSRQMLHYTGSIDDFELSYKLHLTGLQVSNSKHTETTTIRNSVSCSLIDCGNISGSQYTSMAELQTDSDSILSLYFVDNVMTKNPNFNPNPYYNGEMMSGSEFIGDTGSLYMLNRDDTFWDGDSSWDMQSSAYFKDTLLLKFKNEYLAKGIKDYVLDLINAEMDGSYIRLKGGKKVGYFGGPLDRNMTLLTLTLKDITNISSSFRYKDFDDFSNITLSYSDIISGIRNELNNYNSLTSSTDYYQPDSDNNFVITDSDNNIKYYIPSPVLLDSNFNKVTDDTVHTLKEISDGVYEYKKYPSRNLLLSGVSGSVNYIDGTTAYVGSSLYDGKVYRGIEASWSTARNSAVGTGADNDLDKGIVAGVNRSSNKLWGTTYVVTRGLMAFDTSGISQALSGVMNLYVDPVNTDGGDFIAVEWDEGPNIGTGDFDGFTSTIYVNEVSNASITTNQYNAWTLTSAALTDVADSSRLDVMLREHTYDYSNSQPGYDQEKSLYVYATDTDGTSKDPYLDIIESIVILPRIKILSGNLTLKSGTITIK